MPNTDHKRYDAQWTASVLCNRTDTVPCASMSFSLCPTIAEVSLERVDYAFFMDAILYTKFYKLRCKFNLGTRTHPQGGICCRLWKPKTQVYNRW